MIIYIGDSLGEELQDELKNDYRQNLRSAGRIQKKLLSNFLLPWGSKTVGWQGRGRGSLGHEQAKNRFWAVLPCLRVQVLDLTEIYFPFSTVIFTSASNKV